jgi:hypothetical protein
MAEPGTRHEAMLKNAKFLVALLEQPEFGCFTWHEAIHNTMKELKEAYYDKVFEGDKPKQG